MESILLAYARHDLPDDLFGIAERQKREQAMHDAIAEVTRLLQIDELDPWSADVKASDQVLDRVFRLFFKKLAIPLQLRKSDYHILAGLVPKEYLDREVKEKLDAIVAVANGANRGRSNPMARNKKTTTPVESIRHKDEAQEHPD